LTTWAWAALPVGTFTLPQPALVMPPWIFDVHLRGRAGRLRRGRPFGFRHLSAAGRWDQVRPAHPELVLDLRDPHNGLLINAASPHAVDTAAIHNMLPGAYQAGGVRWVYPLSVNTRRPARAPP